MERLSSGVIAILLAFSLCLLNSCQSKRPETAGYSAAFKPIYDTVNTLFVTGKTDLGLYYLDSAAGNIKNKSIDDRFRIYSFNYVWQRSKGNNKKALLYADSMLSLAQKSVTDKQYVANYVEANMAIGDADFAMQKFNDAYRHYFEGFRFGNNTLNKEALSDYSYRMGMILYKMGHFKLAANYFKECFRLSPNTADRFADFYRNQEVLDNIALSYKHNNQADSAIFYFNKTLKYIDKEGLAYKYRANMLEVAKGVVFGNKAEVLIAQRDTAGAIQLLKKSIAVNLQKGNDNRDAELAELKLAGLYFDHHDDDLMHTLLSALRLQLDSVKNETAEADWNRMMSGYYLRKRDFQRSLAYLQTYNILADAGTKKLNLLKESDVNQQLDGFEKQLLIDNLKDNNRTQRGFLYGAVICSLMGLAIILLVVRNWKRSKQDIQIVNSLNKRVNIQKIDLEKTLEELKSSISEKDRILRTVAHDLRNPIGGIASLTLVMEDDDFTAEQRELINLIKETSNNSLELINEILEVTNDGAAKLKKEWVDINGLVGKSVELLRFKAAEKKQHIQLHLLESAEELKISREKIWRVISNLITNSIKFSVIGGTIAVKIRDLKKDVEISIKDNGIGIPEDMKPKIFNMFTDAKRPGTAGEKSFGLGLSICKQIVESHGGKIWFESKLGSGTTFYVKLPKPGTPKVSPLKSQQANALTV